MQVPAQVEYERATSVGHALELLARFGPQARLLAGGHSLIPMMKLRLAQPETLIDINGLSELSFIERGAAGELRIGALTRHAELLDSALAGTLFPILADAERVIADPIVRNWGTIGGSLCQADPSEDLSAVFAALRATMVIRGAEGVRTVPARSFHTAPYETVVGPAEILTEIQIAIAPGTGGLGGPGGPGAAARGGPAAEAGPFLMGSAYEKVMRRVGDWPVGAAGAVLWLAAGPAAAPAAGGTGGPGVACTIAAAGIGLSAVGARNFVAAEAEGSLRGGPATEEAFAIAGDLAAANCRPVSDLRGPTDYKRHLARELTIRALRTALDRALGRAPGQDG